MNAIFQNLTNGNLKEALKQGKRHTYTRLIDMGEDYGYTRKQAINRAKYLKNIISLQAYCENELDN